MSITIAALVLCVYCACPVVSQYDPSGHKGTTTSIQQVFEGRCWDYEVTRYKTELPRVQASCKELWTLFAKAFSYKPPCYVSMKNYFPYLESAQQKVPTNKTMFWSGVFSLAHRFGQDAQRYITLEDTLIGYLASSITWCGQSIDPGMNFTRCPAWNDCPLEAAESFWAGASTTFAMEASGSVVLMLDGSDPSRPAYRRSSFFGKYELPNLGTAVTEVIVLVTHELDKPKREVCGTGSLLELQKDVLAIKKRFLCKDDPLAVMHLLCADDPQSRECKLAGLHQAGALARSDKSRASKRRPTSAVRLINQMADHFN